MRDFTVGVTYGELVALRLAVDEAVDRWEKRYIEMCMKKLSPDGYAAQARLMARLEAARLLQRRLRPRQANAQVRS